MRRSSIGMMAVLAAGSLVLSACGGSDNSSGDSNGKTELKLVVADYGTGPSNTSAKYWKNIASAFHKKNPKISVKVTTINWNDWTSQLQTMIQNKQYPDITEGTYFSTYAQEGLLYPASDVLSKPDNLLPSMKDQGSYKGKQYGMPWTTSSRTLFYNKKLFKKAGISSPPQTWNDVKKDAAKIKALGKTGFGLPLGSEEAQAETLLWFLGNGGNYQDKSGKWTIDSSKNVAAMNFLKGMVKAGDTEPNPGSKNRTDLWKQFADGSIGMINGAPQLIPIIEKAGKLKKSDWASVPIVGKNGPLDTTLGVCDNIMAFNKNGHQKQIKKFLDFAYQDKYQIKFDKEYDLLPGTVSASDQLKSDPIFGSFMKALPKAVQYPSSTGWSKVQSQIQHTIGTAMSGNPKSVLGSIQQTAEKAG